MSLKDTPAREILEEILSLETGEAICLVLEREPAEGWFFAKDIDGELTFCSFVPSVGYKKTELSREVLKEWLGRIPPEMSKSELSVVFSMAMHASKEIEYQLW